MYKKLLFLFFIPFLALSQTQIGNDIVGYNIDDENACSVAISDDGKIIAVGAIDAPFNSLNGISEGFVRVFENDLGSWKQIGQDIYGKNIGDLSGFSVALSSNGQILAIGAIWNSDNGSAAGHVRIYENILGVWTQIGNDINGKYAYQRSGFSISLSADGLTIVIGAPGDYTNGTHSGQVRVFEFVSGAWTQVGQDINGVASYDNNGVSVYISANGKRIIMGADNHDNDQSNYISGAGHARVFENIQGVWQQIGQDIDGKLYTDMFGRAVSMSANGDIIAVGAPSVFNVPGYVSVYKYILGNWQQVGSDITGDIIEGFGQSISISGDGTVIAVGAPYDEKKGQFTGRSSIYKFIANSWVKVGQYIEGDDAGDYSGLSIALSKDGNTVIVGSPAIHQGKAGYVPTKSGYARIYGLTQILSSDSFVLENFNIYPNPTSDVLNISLDNDLILQEVIIYNSLGQIVKKSNKTKIDVSSLSEGMYHAEVKTNKGKASKKIIIN